MEYSKKNEYYKENINQRQKNQIQRPNRIQRQTNQIQRQTNSSTNIINDNDINEINDINDINEINDNNLEEEQEDTNLQHIRYLNNLKKNIQDHLKNMQEYMKENQLECDDFMKTLCEDMNISYKALNTTQSIMYVGARQHSQGRQRSYNVSQMDNDSDSDNIDNDNNDKTMNMSYTTPRQAKIMRDVSQRDPYQIQGIATYNDQTQDQYQTQKLY
jgi:phage host-nuclease inhibitor protein Gam